MMFKSAYHPAGAAEIRPEMRFREAAAAYMGSRTFVTPEGEYRTFNGRYIRATTVKNYRSYVRSLSLFFGELRLEEIRLDHLRKYQQARLAGAAPFIRPRRPGQPAAPCPTKAQHVNQELCLLRAMLRRAKVWDGSLGDYYEELQEVESELPRALTLDEERRWLEVSASQQRWHTVHWYSVLALGTCMSTNEIRALKLRDVNLPAQILTVSSEGSKNRYRQRTIPLREPQTLWAMEQLIKRAWELGSRDPDHYIFPFVLGHNPVPHRPMSVQGLKKPWQEVRQATGLLQFRMYDTRHTAITRLAENGVPVTVIMDLAGHISPRMTQHYTHVSEQAKVIAMRQASQGRYGWADPRPALPVPSVPILYDNKAVLDGSIVGKSAGRNLLRIPQPRIQRAPDTSRAIAQGTWSTFTTIGRPFGSRGST